MSYRIFITMEANDGQRSFGTFDYDRDYLQPQEPQDELDPSDYVFSAGQWIYVGDC